MIFVKRLLKLMNLMVVKGLSITDSAPFFE